MTVTASGYARSRNELYETEPWATECLLRHFPVSGLRVLEPAAGNHRIANVLRLHGAQVFTSDIETCRVDHDAVVDFLTDDPVRLFPGVDAVITNPPFGSGNKLARTFCELALERCDGLVAMLLSAKFDFGSTRVHLFRDNPRFCAKIALLDRIQWFPGDTSGTEDHAWFVWAPSSLAGRPPQMLWERNPAKAKTGNQAPA